MDNGLDNQGYIINKASYSNVYSYYRTVLNFVLEKFKEKNLLARIHSVYCYGSIPIGEAVKFESDLDLIVIMYEYSEEVDLFIFNQIKQDILNKYNYLTKIDMPLCNLDELFKSENIMELGFKIKTSSICLYGKNIENTIQKFKPTKELVFFFNNQINDLLNEYYLYFQTIEDKKLITLLSKQISKKIIRGLFGTLVEKHNIWANSSQDMCSKYCHFNPKDKEDINTLYQISKKGTNNKIKIISLIDKFKPQINQFYK